MLVIALDTSTPAVTAGLVRLDGRVPCAVAQRVTVNPRAHGELLTPHLWEALAAADLPATAADAIVCGSGPGPFTGLRTGMVTAAALGHALDLPVYPVCGLDAVAAAVPGPDRVVVLSDARRREFYWAAYAGRTGPDDVGAHAEFAAPRDRLDGPHVDAPGRVREQAAELGISRAAGELADRAAELGLASATSSPADVEPESTSAAPDAIRATVYPSPVGLVTVAAESLVSGVEPDPLVPLYLRRPDAARPGPRKRVSSALEEARSRT